MNIYLEIFGYIGTALVLLSMMMTSVVRLRVMNIAGSVITMIYAFIGSALPVAFLNLGLILINGWQLIRLRQNRTVYTHVHVGAGDRSLRYFLDHYGADIGKRCPGFSSDLREDAEVHMVYAGAEPAGVLVGVRDGDALKVALDYAVPRHRDLSVAAFLSPRLEEMGVARLVTSVN